MTSLGQYYPHPPAIHHHRNKTKTRPLMLVFVASWISFIKIIPMLHLPVSIFCSQLGKLAILWSNKNWPSLPEENWQTLILWKNLARTLPSVYPIPTKQMAEKLVTGCRNLLYIILCSIKGFINFRTNIVLWSWFMGSQRILNGALLWNGLRLEGN